MREDIYSCDPASRRRQLPGFERIVSEGAFIVRCCSTIFVAALVGCAVGCNNRPAPPTTQAETKSDSRGKAAPTTQDLAASPRAPLSLGVMPLSVNVPAGWKVQSPNDGQSMFLQGPAPNGDIAIALSRRPEADKKLMDVIIATGEKSHHDDPATFLLAEKRDRGEFTLFQTQKIYRPRGTAPPDASGHANALPPLLDWTVSVFVPSAGGRYRDYELNFVGLTLQQYQQDKDFLNSIVNSISYTPNSDSGI